METVKVYSRKPWTLDSLRNRILRELISESSLTDISTLTDKWAKELDAKTDKRAENEFVVGLFIYMAEDLH